MSNSRNPKNWTAQEWSEERSEFFIQRACLNYERQWLRNGLAVIKQRIGTLVLSGDSEEELAGQLAHAREIEAEIRSLA